MNNMNMEKRARALERKFWVYGGYFGFMTVLFVLVAVISILRQGRSETESLKLSNMQNMDTEKQASELER